MSLNFCSAVLATFRRVDTVKSRTFLAAALGWAAEKGQALDH